MLVTRLQPTGNQCHLPRVKPEHAASAARPCGPWKADGFADRSHRPDAVRYMSVDPATQGSTARQGDTPWAREKTARIAAHPQLPGRFRRMWQVVDSNHRRRSRRFYSPLLLPESPPADQHIRASRRKFGPPPSAVRPCAPDFGAVKATDGGGKGHGQGRTARAGAVC